MLRLFLCSDITGQASYQINLPYRLWLLLNYLLFISSICIQFSESSDLVEITTSIQGALETFGVGQSNRGHLIVMNKPTIVQGDVTHVMGDKVNIGQQNTTYVKKETGAQ